MAKNPGSKTRRSKDFPRDLTGRESVTGEGRPSLAGNLTGDDLHEDEVIKVIHDDIVIYLRFWLQSKGQVRGKVSRAAGK